MKSQLAPKHNGEPLNARVGGWATYLIGQLRYPFPTCICIDKTYNYIYIYLLSLYSIQRYCYTSKYTLNVYIYIYQILTFKLLNETRNFETLNPSPSKIGPTCFFSPNPCRLRFDLAPLAHLELVGFCMKNLQNHTGQVGSMQLVQSMNNYATCMCHSRNLEQISHHFQNFIRKKLYLKCSWNEESDHKIHKYLSPTWKNPYRKMLLFMRISLSLTLFGSEGSCSSLRCEQIHPEPGPQGVPTRP